VSVPEPTPEESPDEADPPVDRAEGSSTELGPTADRAGGPSAEPTDGPTAELAAELQRVLLVSSRILRSQSASGDVSVPQFSVLAYLERSGESTPGALADFEHVSPPVMTRILGRLEQAGLVRRSAHPGDGRQVRVTLSEEGKQVVLAGREHRHAWLRERIDAASPDQRASLREAAEVLREILIPPRQ